MVRSCGLVVSPSADAVSFSTPWAEPVTHPSIPTSSALVVVEATAPAAPPTRPPAAPGRLPVSRSPPAGPTAEVRSASAGVSHTVPQAS